MSRVQRVFRELPTAEAPEPLPMPKNIKELRTKVQGVKAHLQWLRLIFLIDVCAYPDGSSEGHNRSPWDYALQDGGVTYEIGLGISHGGEV